MNNTIIYKRQNSPFMYCHNFDTGIVESICSDPQTLRFERHREAIDKDSLLADLIDEDADFISQNDYSIEKNKTLVNIFD